MRIVVVIPARNEEKSIGKVIDYLYRQTLSPNEIIVVDDGSVDKTPDIALRKGCIVIKLPYHTESYVGKPNLAYVINMGLARARELEPDYVMILGSEHLLPSFYIERIITRMEKDQRIAIASGRIEGEPCREDVPRGSGRIVNASFWLKLNDMKYPVYWGWESWLYLKAQQMGFKTRCYKDIPSVTLRSTSPRKPEVMGKEMYALGYYWLYALGKIVLFSTKGFFLGSIRALVEYFAHPGVKRMDISSYVSAKQKKELAMRIKSFLYRLF